MNLRVLILLVSLLANIVLATLLVRNDSKTIVTRKNPDVEKTATTTKSSQNESAASVERTASTISEIPSAFHWSQLESDDYKKYIAALREFGVPERTIRDIVIADVNKLYRPKFAVLRPRKKTDKEKEKFWETRTWGMNRDMTTKEQREQTRLLQKEKDELIKELLGKDVYQEMAKESGYPDFMERQFGNLTAEQREKVQDIQQRFGEMSSEIYAKAEGYIDQDTQADLKKIRKKQRDELATVLTAEQLEEYELHSSDTAQQMKWQLSYFEPDEKEFRSIFKYKQSLEDLESPRGSYSEDAPKLSAEERKALSEKKKELTAEFEKVLDPDRLKEFKLQEDYAYRNLFEAGVPKENVFKVADMKTQSEEAAKKVRSDKTMTPEQRSEALKAIADEAKKELANLLGERRGKAYVNNGGWWLRNIAPSSNN
jgi:hypothetical protein